ncbi:MAG: NfeD family protein [Opitutales bacterium]
MNAVLLLFLLGVLLLAAEVFMPGAVLGILGGVAMLTGCLISFRQFGPTGGALATVIALALLGLTLYIELIWLPKSRFGKKLVVQSASDATSQPPLAEPGSVVGKTAEAVTTLAPSGYVVVEGRRYEAFCQAGHVPKGTALRVVGLDNFRLIVTKP